VPRIVIHRVENDRDYNGLDCPWNSPRKIDIDYAQVADSVFGMVVTIA
jgi:hypothetical protein